MQKTQQFLVLTGIVLIFLMGILSPWVYVDDAKIAHPMDYAPIWKRPIEQQHDSAEFFGIKLQLNVQKQTANTIDLYRLLMQIAILAGVTGGAVVMLRKAST